MLVYIYVFRPCMTIPGDLIYTWILSFEYLRPEYDGWGDGVCKSRVRSVHTFYMREDVSQATSSQCVPVCIEMARYAFAIHKVDISHRHLHSETLRHLLKLLQDYSL